MDEEILIIDSNTRNEKIKNFFINNKRKLIVTIIVVFVILITYFLYGTHIDKKKKQLANQYNLTIINFNSNNNKKTVNELINIVNKNDETYSPLALYFLIDNNLIQNRDQINTMFDSLIKKTKLKLEIKNLIIYKKGLYNADNLSENELIDILNPIINSESIWKSHALYLIGEYFYSQNEKNKAKEFFQQIITLENSNSDIKLKAIKRIKRDFSE